MIEVKELYKSYGNVQILKGASLSLKEGKTLVILGRSGVGKSVLLRQITALEEPDRGQVWIDGINLFQVAISKREETLKNVAMLFQSAALFDSLTVFENVAFYIYQHGMYLKGKKLQQGELKDRVAHALEMVGLQGSESKMPADLSGGMRKRAALARAIVYEPKILLYDEPTTGLDPVTARQINDLIIQVQDKFQSTSIVVTHDPQTAHTVADELVLHKDGKLLYQSKKEEFFTVDEPLIKSFCSYMCESS